MSTKKRSLKHPGVTLIKPKPEQRIRWRARFTDPDSGKTKWVTLDPSLRTREQRKDWAARWSRQLAQRRLDLDAGAARTTGTPLVDAVERYYRAHPELRPATLKVYRDATGKLIDWAERARVRSADDLTRARLMAFREQLVNEQKHSAARNGKRGQQRRLKERRSPHTINRELRATRTVLGYLLDLDLLPKLSQDDLRRALKRLPAPVERMDYLKPKQLQKLLEAAQRHDSEVFKATRAEHAGSRLTGTTARYQPIAPFVAFCLLTGMRFGEAIALDWSQVDLDALDATGKPVGEVYVTTASKTAKARTVGLEVSPALRKLLIAQKFRTGGKGSVFELTRETARAAGKRLVIDYGAPKTFGWQALRRTCGTYLTNSPGIFGAASAYRSAQQLGHSVAIAEKNYVGLLRGIPADARTLEEAMQVEAQVQQVIASAGMSRAPARTRKVG
jgi:integrase